jgi:hypothetical protein
VARLERLKERTDRWTEWEGEWIPLGRVRANAG